MGQLQPLTAVFPQKCTGRPTCIFWANLTPSLLAAVVQLDTSNLAQFEAACAGVDVVVHLAADASPAADFYGSLLDRNIKVLGCL
jgi:nucleoside-diphosphate-sugar epimerase